MKTHRLATLAAAMLVGGLGSLAPSTFVPANTSVIEAAQATRSTPATVPVATQLQIQRIMGLGSDTVLVSERKHPIWLGTAKRGNRRGRARFNFNR